MRHGMRYSNFILSNVVRPHVIGLLLFILVVQSVTFPIMARAQSPECTTQYLQSIGAQVIQCPGSSSLVCQNTSGVLVGNDNQEKAFRYFIGQGLTEEQSAGIIGNMVRESGVDPERIQDSNSGGFGRRSKNPNDAGSLGWGLIQWTPGGKILNNAIEAEIRNANNTGPVTTEAEALEVIYRLDVQLEIVWWHLNVRTPTGLRNVLPRFKQTTTVEEATEFFEDEVEGAGVVALQERINFAKEILQLYGGGISNAFSAGSGTGSCQPINSTNGTFTVYSQYDPKWRNLPYSTSTIGKSGCGPAALAMVITALTGTVVEPPETAQRAADAGMYVSGSGSKWTITPTLAEDYNLNVELINPEIAEIDAALNAGKMIVTSGSGAVPFTEGGHYIVIRGITSEGKWLIGDSGHDDTSDKEWEPADIIGQMRTRTGSQYAIYN